MCDGLKDDSTDDAMYLFSYQGHVTTYFGFPTMPGMNDFCLSCVFPLGWEMDV